MIDVKGKPLEVMKTPGGWVWLRLPHSQVDEVKRLLDQRGIRYEAYPRNLIGKEVDFKDVLEAADKDAVTLLVVNKELNEVLYERPAGWFACLEERAKLGCPTPAAVEQFAEAKAPRDVLVHNRGVATKTYEAKAGKLARHKEGERIEITEAYHRATWELVRKVAADVADAAGAKV